MPIFTATKLKKVEEYYFSKKLSEVKKLQLIGKDIINLGIGNPDLPTHKSVIEELTKSAFLSESNYYQSYKGLDELRFAFSEWYKRIYDVNLNHENEILPLMGSKEGILHISLAFTNENDTVLIPNTGYPTYSSVSNLLNLNIKYYNLTEKNNWLPDFNELEKLTDVKTKILWINYPHMPTGALISENQLKKIVEFAYKKNILIVNDNPYSLILNPNPQSILKFEQYRDNVLELNSLSKSHNMAGWRIGMVGGSKSNIDNILKVKSNFDSGMFKPVQQAAIKALSLEYEWFEQINKIYTERRNIIWKMLDKLNCKYNTNSGGLFVWSSIPNNFSSGEEFSDYLLYEKSVFAAPGIVFGTNGKNFIRFSLCATQSILNEVFNRIIN